MDDCLKVLVRDAFRRPALHYRLNLRFLMEVLEVFACVDQQKLLHSDQVIEKHNAFIPSISTFSQNDLTI